MINIARLEAFLKVMEQQSPQEWAWKREKTRQFWYVDYQTSYPPFQFLIEFNDEMLYIQYLFQDVQIRSQCWLALYRVLLRLNEELSLVKFGLTSYGNLTMMGELPAAQFSLEIFQNLLYLMVHYLEQLYWEIGLVAESPELALFLTGHEASLAQLDRRVHEMVKAIKVEGLAETA